MSADGTVNERIPAVRGQMLPVVGQVGGERINIDVAASDEIVCTELGRDAARRLRNALDAFLTPLAPAAGSREGADR